jgi:hypothetical protein
MLSEAKIKARSVASRQNIYNYDFDAKLRFALLASLRLENFHAKNLLFFKLLIFERFI